MPRTTNYNGGSYTYDPVGGGGSGDQFGDAMAYMDKMFQQSKALQMKDGQNKLEMKGIAAGNGYV